MGLLGDLFGEGGGNAQTQSQTSTTSTSTTNAQDNRVVADTGSVAVSGGSTSTINTSDMGALQKAADISMQAVVGATQIATNANASANKLASDSIAQIKQAYDDAIVQAQGAASGNRTIAMIGIAVAGLIGMQMLGKGAKK